jgi:hypothetical protein
MQTAGKNSAQISDHTTVDGSLSFREAVNAAGSAGVLNQEATRMFIIITFSLIHIR